MGGKPEELAFRAAHADDPEDGLRAVVALRTTLEALEEQHVRDAIRGGVSWGRVAGLLGVSRQAAHKRFATRCRAAGEQDQARIGATEQARRTVRIAAEEAAAMGHGSTGPEHLLLALLRDDQGVAVLVLEEHGVHYSAARREVRRLYGEPHLGDDPPASGPRAPLSTRAREVLDRAVREAAARGDRHVGVEHVLDALARDAGGGAVSALEALGADPDEVAATLGSHLGRRHMALSA